jgi:hypothetical protein
MPSNNNNEYNVYNKFDSNFVNYGELYKSPMDMKQDSKQLISHYADALIKGGDSPVYKEAPYLVGNRYFISTNSNCLDNDDNIHTRSILVDNVNASAMETTEGGNTGLIYSLLASLKTINSSDTFNEMKDGEPVEYENNNNTDYLNDVEIPKCNEITVFANNKRNDTISGWVTNRDRSEIDPLSISEGFVGDYLKGEILPGDFQSALERTSAAVEAEAEAVVEESQKAQEETLNSANKVADKGKDTANNKQKNNSNVTKNSMKSIGESSNRAFTKARKRGAGKELKREAKKYLRENKNEDVIFFLKELLNTFYECNGEIIEDEKKTVEKPKPKITDKEQARYDYYKSLLDRGAAKSAIYNAMVSENLDTRLLIPEGLEVVTKEKEEDEEEDDTTKNIRISAKCVYAIYEDNPRKDVEHIFAEMSNLINANKTNTNDLEVPGIPKSTTNSLHHIFGGGSFGQSNEYTKIIKKLDIYRLRIAMEIVRYRDIDTYGQCAAIDPFEGFSHFDDSSNSFINWTSCLYMIALLFIVFFIIYKVIFRLLLNK